MFLSSLNKAAPRIDVDQKLKDLRRNLWAGAVVLILFTTIAGPFLLSASDSYSDMTQRLEKIFGSQRRFLADASHELRTPLTVIRGELEVLLSSQRTTEEYREQIESTLEEVDRLTRMVNNLLTLAEFDSGQWASAKSTFDLHASCCNLSEKLLPLLRKTKTRLEVKPGPAVHFDGDRIAMERVLLNLMDNAIRHTPEGKSVHVEITRQDKRILLIISDEGTGISAEDLPRIFDRFYRVDKARTREQGGTGLGLAIVKGIVEAHQGKIEVASELNQGTKFTITLPAI
jgi:heavy metal sensor kinase